MLGCYYSKIDSAEMYSQMLSWLVCRAPDVSQGHSRVKPVENAEGQGDVAEYGPALQRVKLLLGLINIPLEKYGVHDVDCQVGHNQKHEGIAPHFVLLESKRV